jgi:hypothetical protein
MPASVVAIRSISVGVTAKSRGSFASLATTACPAAVVLDQILLSGWGGASQACGGIGVGASAGPLTLGCGGQGRASGRIEGRRHRRSVAENQGGGLGRDASGCWGHGCARWRQVRGRLRVWPRLLRAWRRGLGRDAGAAACMAGGCCAHGGGVGAGRGGGCAHGRVPVAEGAGAGARGDNRTISDGGGGTVSDGDMAWL